MKVWCFWMALTICCVTLMPLFAARSLLIGARSAPPSRTRSRRGE